MWVRPLRHVGQTGAIALAVSTAMLLTLRASDLGAQSRPLEGRVENTATTLPIDGAQILVSGTGIGTITRADGSFLLQVPEGEIRLSIQHLGYHTREILVEPGENQLVVALDVAVLRVDELVVTGRATAIARSLLPNAVSTLSTGQLNRVPSQTVEQSMQGKIAGANIQATNGAPPVAMSVELRGVTSINGDSKPLYIVDGVIVSNDQLGSGVGAVTFVSGEQHNAPNRLADLNPHEIASIEILKGASAAAIYGAKASNGVIIITTRRGAPRSGAPEFRLEVSLGVPFLSNTIGIREFETLDKAVGTFGPAAADFWEPGLFFDHEKELAGQNPLNFDIYGSVAGGGASTQYFLSGLAKQEDGIIIGTGYDKLSGRFNLNQALGSVGEFVLSTSLMRSNTARGFTNNDNRGVSYWIALATSPAFIDLRGRPDGTFPLNPFGPSNMFETASEGANKEDLTRFIGSGQLTLEPLRSERHTLSLTAFGGFDYYKQFNDVLTDPELQFEESFFLPGTSFTGETDSELLNLDATAVHTYVADGAVEATTSLGVQFERRERQGTFVTRRDLAAAPDEMFVSEDSTHLKTEDFGFYIQEEVVIGDRFYVSAGIRGDQSSNNADPDQLFWYPKAAASYRFDFASGALDMLKLRAAFGQSGNQPLFGTKFTVLRLDELSGLPTLRLASTTAAPDLGPERQTEFEFGADLSLLRGRASFELTGFQTNVDDMLLTQALHESAGFDILHFNGGAMRQRGVEAQARGVPILSPGAEWGIDVTFSLIRGKVTDLPVAPFLAPNHFADLGTFLIEEGQSPTRFVGNDTLPDGRVDPLVDLGESRPSFIVGLSSDLRLGDFTGFMLWDWKQGQHVSNLTAWLMDIFGNAPDFDVPCTDPGCFPGETLGEMRLRLYPNRVTSIYMEDASFLKLREISVTWDVPQELTRALWGGLTAMQLSVSARDWLRFTGYKGLDPEVSNFGIQSVSRGQDVAPYPPSRSFWFTLSAFF